MTTEVEYLNYISQQMDAVLTFLTIFLIYIVWKSLSSFIDWLFFS